MDEIGWNIGEWLTRESFSMHDTHAYKLISSYYSFKPWMTMPQVNCIAQPTIRFSLFHWIEWIRITTKLSFSSSLYETHDRDTYQKSLSSMKIISIDKAFITMKRMRLLPRIHLTQSWLVTSTTCEYKWITITWNSLIF